MSDILLARFPLTLLALDLIGLVLFPAGGGEDVSL